MTQPDTNRTRSLLLERVRMLFKYESSKYLLLSKTSTNPFKHFWISMVSDHGHCSNIIL